MSWLGRDRSPIAGGETLRPLDDGRCGPLTAREAFEEAVRDIDGVDPEGELLHILSSEDVNAQGRASGWEFSARFPRRQGRGTFRIEPVPDDSDARRLQARVTLRSDRPAGIAGELLKRLGGDPAAQAYVQGAWKKAEPATLPRDFRDSPESVRELAAKGVDWVTGASFPIASHAVSPQDIFWCVRIGRREFHVRLSTRG